MDGLIDPFYTSVESGKGPNDIDRGEIFLDQPMYVPARWGLRLSNFDPTDVADPDFEVSGRTEDIFNHPPLKRYKLQHGEAFVVGKAKLHRPVIVLAANGHELMAGPDIARRADTYLCAPVYGSDQFSPSTRARIRAYEFPNYFFLPASVDPHFDEGFVRFDHMQSITRDHLRQRRTASLSAEALDALDEWLVNYLTSRLATDSLVAQYRQEELARLRSDSDN